MNFIKSAKYEVHTIQVNKICLSAFDDKKYILDDEISTLSYGHSKIDNIIEYKLLVCVHVFSR